jgi:tRNA(Ile)-lysidine synthase
MTRNYIPQILSRVRGAIQRNHMIEPGDQIGVAVSGGVDSVVLLDILTHLKEELHISLMVLHLNHGIRGEEAERDQQFVQALSNKYALPYFVREVDVPGHMQERSLSLQESARELRYRFFKESLHIHALDKIAIGQTADDQAETVLMRVLTGGGAGSLKGIPAVRRSYVRPLIDVWRGELLTYAQHRGISFVEDSSNAKKAYLRNRIRHELLPILQEYNPNIKERLLQLAQVLGADENYLDTLVGQVIKRIVAEDEEVSISVSQLLSLPPALQTRVLQHAFMRSSGGEVLEYRHVRGILQLIQGKKGSKRLALPHGHWACRIYDTLVLERGEKQSEKITPETELLIPGGTRLEGFGKEIEAAVVEGRITPRSNPREACLDYHQLGFPLRVRSFRPGDRFMPLGMKGNKKLKDFFIDLKVPRSERSKIPLVISEGDICWVGGWRIDERFKIAEETKKSVKLTIRDL